MKILLTYFEPFGGKTTNTTMKVSEYINGVDKILLPDYKYIKPNIIERYHKFNFRKQILNKKYKISLNDMTEKEMTQQLNFHRIYDCGLLRYVWKK
jgi:pyrrolidone-carboxylate peptidase